MIDIAVIDSNHLQLAIYNVPSNLNHEGIEEWIEDNTDHRLSEISWGVFNGLVQDNRDMDDLPF